MNDTKIIIVPGGGLCPHCNKKIKYSIRMTSPAIYWMLKQEDLDAVKEKIKKEVQNIKFKNAKNKQEMLDWLDRADTSIGPDEADSVIKQIKEEEKQRNDNNQKTKTE